MMICNSGGCVMFLMMGKVLEYKLGFVYFKVSGGEYGFFLSEFMYLDKLDLWIIYFGGVIIFLSWVVWMCLSNVILDVGLVGLLLWFVVKVWFFKYFVFINNDFNGILLVEFCKLILKMLGVSGNSFMGKILSCLSYFFVLLFNDLFIGFFGNEGLCGILFFFCSF